MNLSELTRSTAFRIAAIFAGLFLVTVLAIFAVLYALITSEIERKLKAQILEVRDTLVVVQEHGDFQALTKMIARKGPTTAEAEDIYLLTGEDGHYVAGNVKTMPKFEAVKIAIPVTCLIIALFGAPLGITGGHRGGGAYGVAVSLATTLVFLMSVQISKAVGSGGLLPPMVAVWLPNAVFGLAGIVLFARAKT